jgi:transposase
MMDGKLLLVSNTPDLTPKEIVLRYKSLADIERGFRVLKSELEIGPVFHRLPDRTRAHASICFMALIIHRIIRQRLKQSSSSFSPERALETLRRIQRHRITLNDKTHTGISTLSDEQGELLGSLNVDKPIESKQLSLL